MAKLSKSDCLSTINLTQCQLIRMGFDKSVFCDYRKKGLIGQIKLKSCFSRCTERQGSRVVSGGVLFKDAAHD